MNHTIYNQDCISGMREGWRRDRAKKQGENNEVQCNPA